MVKVILEYHPIGYTILILMTLVLLKLIIPFLLIEKTRTDVLNSIKFFMSTSAFVFVIKLFKYLTVVIAAGVMEGFEKI